MDKLEEQILRLAAEKGLINSEELNALNTPDLLATLVKRGMLSNSVVETLKAELMVEAADTLANPPALLKNEMKEEEISIACFGRYIQLQLIGQGGMARVFRAYDPILSRTIALKLLYEESEKLMLEARNQARVEHENVCKVYEVGEVEGRQYICMQYVQGKTLGDVAGEMNLKEKVDVVRKISDAVHAAHKNGLVHRDIKPSNIMLERTDAGIWKPYILDFGLARVQAAPGITQKGVVVGTPLYMAPEQARSGKPDVRSDVYSLGATLYELIAGRPPFTGTSAEVILKVLQEDPVSLHKIISGVPIDLETIVMKCLDKDPAARYESAKALAEDLRHYLEGEPISARPVSLPQRVWKRAKKNRVAAFIFTFALVVTVVLISLLFLTRWKASVQAQYASEFGEEIRYIEAMLLTTYTAPLHDIRPKLTLARQRLRQIEQRMLKLGDWASGPGNNALGQGYLVLKEYEQSKNFLQKAWASGYQNPSTAYALGKVQGILWRQTLIDADRLTSQSLQEEMRKKAEEEYLRPAIQNLKLARVHAETPAYVEALVSLYEKKYADAFEKSRQALERSSRPYEVWKLLGDIHFAVGREASERGEYEAALKSFQSAGESYNRAADLARSDQDIYFADAERWIRTAFVLTQKGEQIQSPEKGSEACDKAIMIQPENERAYLCKADVYLQHGINQIYSSGDARPNLRMSIEVAREASKHNPDIAEPHDRAAVAYLRMAEYETANSMDPRPSLKAGIAESQKALQLNPHDSDAYFSLAGAYFYMGEYELAHGGNPIPLLERVIEIMQKNLKSFIRDSYSFNLLGLAHLDIGEYRLRHGDDPRADLQKSIEAYRSALKINPKAPAVYLNMGLVYQDIAKYELSHGIDPSHTFEQSIRQYDQSLAISNNFAYACHDRGLVYLQSAQYKLQLGKDPQQDVADAMSAFRRTLEINPELTHPHGSIASSHLLLAKQAFAHGKDPGMHLKNSREAAEDYVKKDESFYEPYRILGQIELLAARSAILNHRSPEKFFDRAVKLLKKSTELNKNEIEVFRELADVYRWEAEWILERKQSAARSIDQGMKAIEGAAKLNASDPETLAIRGALKLVSARDSKDRQFKIAFANEASELFRSALAGNRFLKREYEPLQKMAESLR